MIVPIELANPIEVIRSSHIDSNLSYIDSNNYGLCLRAAKDLAKGVVVAIPDFEITDCEYIAQHDSVDYRHVALIGIGPDGKPIWARVRGKWAYCNHSCDPNCFVAKSWEITTSREVQKGEELTIAYDAFIPNFPWPNEWNFACSCGASNCKLIIDEYRMDIVSPLMKLFHPRCLQYFKTDKE